MDWSRYAGLGLLILGGAALVTQVRRAGAWPTRLRRVLLPLTVVLAGYVLAIVPWQIELTRGRIEREGSVVVRAIEDYRARVGAFPETLSALGVDVPELGYPLSYETGTSDGEGWFWFGVGDYFEDGFTASWDSRKPGQGWYWDT